MILKKLINLYLFIDKIFNFRIRKYYSFAKEHRKNHKGGCVPYDSYMKLFHIVKNYHGKNNKIINILEIGTATGFTSFVMNLGCNIKCKIDTIEKNFEHVKIAKDQFAKYNINNINLLEGKAEEILVNLKNNYYDVIFFDAFAPKKENSTEFERLLKKDGILISANSFLKKTEQSYFEIFQNTSKWLKLQEFEDTVVLCKIF
jgi:predicted O-methyltransferase YrrM